MHMIRAAVLAATLAAASTVAPAHADVILETATYTGVDNSDWSIYDGRWIGAAFTLDKTTEITSIGGQFGAYPSDGQIFGAIVPISSMTGLPEFSPSQIGMAGNSLAHVLFSIPGGAPSDLTEALDVTLGPGSYAVVFGSGAFGATQTGGMGGDNTPIGQPNFVSYFSVWYGDAWSSDDYSGVRITVSGEAVSPVPEASVWAMMGLGFVGLAFMGFHGRMRGSRALG